MKANHSVLILRNFKKGRIKPWVFVHTVAIRCENLETRVLSGFYFDLHYEFFYTMNFPFKCYQRFVSLRKSFPRPCCDSWAHNVVTVPRAETSFGWWPRPGGARWRECGWLWDKTYDHDCALPHGKQHTITALFRSRLRASVPTLTTEKSPCEDFTWCSYVVKVFTFLKTVLCFLEILC